MSDYIFISYAREDIDIVGEITERLNAAGIQVWFDQHIGVGNQWRTEVVKAIKTAKGFILFLSKSSIESQYVENELNVAFSRRIKIYPIRIHDVAIPESMELTIISLQMIDLFKNKEKNVTKLVNDLRKDLGYDFINDKLPSGPKTVDTFQERGNTNFREEITLDNFNKLKVLNGISEKDYHGLTISISIKLIFDTLSLYDVENLQELIWPGYEREIIPIHMMLTSIRSGGHVIGAYDKEHLVGFVYGFVGLDSNKQGGKIISHMVGVHPEYRSLGIGYLLKRAQWQIARHQGFDMISWTQDPLMESNSYFNFRKLGSVSNTYIADYYGQKRDLVNIGLPTDRLEVQLWVNSPRVIQRLRESNSSRFDLTHYLDTGAQVLKIQEIKDGLPIPPMESFDDFSIKQTFPGFILLEIPDDFQSLKNSDFDLAIKWRLYSRSIFEKLFSLGYFVVDFIFLTGPDPQYYYVFTQTL